MPKTLIYNDVQIRNLAMRQLGQKWKLCLFDWEVATTHIPQRDLVEFLSYVISKNVTNSDM
jgi:hydroxymethylglutaryl-CoA reductase (NADPH)